jgi:Leucine-rich repeat (LRR) protein
VKELRGGAFPASLRELDIGNSGVASGGSLRLYPDSFEGLSKLEVLELYQNKLTDADMHPGLFEGMTSLTELYLYSNPDLRSFDAAKLFPNGNNALEHVELKDCSLTHASFEGLPNLKTVRLDAESGGTSLRSFNAVEIFPSGAGKVEVLNLDFCDIESLSNMQELPALKRLKLRGNAELQAFDAAEIFLGGSENLIELVLSECPLTTRLSFEGLGMLRRLTLSNVTSIPSEVFTGLCSLNELGLSSATWVGDTFAGTACPDVLCGAIIVGDARDACCQQASAECSG